MSSLFYHDIQHSLQQETLDRSMMSRAIRLAEKGSYTCSPNPRVGCVICQNNEIIAEGWHQTAGAAHAEIVALEQANSSLEGATVYVSLEPCSHTGKTGPCADALIAAKVSRVVCAMSDPAPHVDGGGIKKMQSAGIDVEVGLLEAEAKVLNPGFIKRMQQSLPFVRVKLAMSLDGRTALLNGESKWITGEASRKDVHAWRARSDAIVTGSETVLKDNPQMTARLENTEIKQPLKCIIDSSHHVPEGMKIFSGEAQTIRVGVDDKSDWQMGRNAEGKVDLKLLLEKLAQVEVNEVWVEAGSRLAGLFIEQNLFDELIIYMAPKILGDKAQPLLQMSALESMQDVESLALLDSRRFGDDWRFVYQKVIPRG